MKISLVSLFSTMLVFALLSSYQAALADTDISLGETPPAVMQAVKAKFPGCKILSLERERRGYEVKCRVNGQNKKVYLSDQGEVLKVRNDDGSDDVAIEELPIAVKQSIMKSFPDAILIKAEKEYERGKMYYEVRFRTLGKKNILNVTPKGKILYGDDDDSSD